LSNILHVNETAQDHNRRPILGFARGFTHICGVTCTELVLDVALLRLRL